MRARIHESRRLGAGASELGGNESVAAMVLGQDGNGGFGSQTRKEARGEAEELTESSWARSRKPGGDWSRGNRRWRSAMYATDNGDGERTGRVVSVLCSGWMKLAVVDLQDVFPHVGDVGGRENADEVAVTA